MDEENRPAELSEEDKPQEQLNSEPSDGSASAAPVLHKNQKDIDRITRQVEARRANENRARTRKWWIKTILMFLLIGVSIYILFPITNSLTDEGTRGFVALVKNASLGYFFLLVGAVLLYIFFESFQYAYILKTSTGKFRIRNAVKVAFLGKYYDAITPLGTGGQPFQIYYLHKKDIPAGVATAVPIVKYTMATFAKGILSVIFFASAFVILPATVTHGGAGAGFIAIYAVAWVSMVLNMLVPILMIFGSLFPRAGKKLVIRIIALLALLHIVKNKYKVTKKYVNEMDEYRRALKEILKRWWLFLPLLLICLVTAAINFSIPFFTTLALANVTPSTDLWLQMFCGGLLSFYSASLVPTPGNSGVIDATSSLVFASVLNHIQGGGAVSAWVILVWRFFTFYVYIFSGVGISIFEIIRSAIRNRRAAKQANSS